MSVQGVSGQDDMEQPHIDVVATVLGHDDPHRRAAVASHLLACPACRSEYDELSATVYDLLPAVPEIQPPLGFDQQVLSRMGITQPVQRRRAGWQWFAAAAVALIVGAGAIAVIATRDDAAEVAGSAERAGAVRALQKVSDGAKVGTVSLSDVGGDPVMVVAIVAAPEGVSYSCRTTFADGSTTESNSWPAGNGAWIVPLPDASTSTIRTVDLIIAGTDTVWSTASFSDASFSNGS